MILLAECNTQEWHALRRQGIGASEAAAACGLSRWELPIDVWSRKVHPQSEDTSEETDAMLLGRLMEPVVASVFEIKTGRRVQRLAPGLYRHCDIAWMLASPDALLEDGTLAEWKTTSRNPDLGTPGTNEVPVEWICQAQQQMAVMGAPAVRFGVLIDGREFREYLVERHSILIDRMTAREAELWRCVEARTPPPVDFAHTFAARAVAAAYREVHLGVQVELDAEAEELVATYEALGLQAQEIERRRQETKAQIMYRLGEAETGLLPSGRTVRRRLIPATTVPASTRRAHVRLTIQSQSQSQSQEE